MRCFTVTRSILRTSGRTGTSGREAIMRKNRAMNRITDRRPRPRRRGRLRPRRPVPGLRRRPRPRPASASTRCWSAAPAARSRSTPASPCVPDHDLELAGDGRHGDRARRRRRPAGHRRHGRRRGRRRRCGPRTAAAPGSCRSAPAPPCWPPPACSTAARPPPTGPGRDRLPRPVPAGRWDFDVLFVDDGDVLTSAGVGAGIDLCLHIVRRDHGSRGRQPGGPPLRGAAVARRRPGAVHRAPGAAGGRHRHRADPGLGAGPAGRAGDAWRRWPRTRG